LYGRDDTSSDYTVWASVAIEQSPNCHEPVIIVTDQTGSTTFYALLLWREIYSMYLFTSQDERNAFRDLTVLETTVPTLALIQDFGNGAPEQQCVYFGSFTSPIDGDGDMIGTMARNPTLKWRFGDVMMEEEALTNGNCPEGYPRQWEYTTPDVEGDAVATSGSRSRSVLFGGITTAIVLAFNSLLR